MPPVLAVPPVPPMAPLLAALAALYCLQSRRCQRFQLCRLCQRVVDFPLEPLGCRGASCAAGSGLPTGATGTSGPTARDIPSEIRVSKAAEEYLDGKFDTIKAAARAWTELSWKGSDVASTTLGRLGVHTGGKCAAEMRPTRASQTSIVLCSCYCCYCWSSRPHPYCHL